MKSEASVRPRAFLTVVILFFLLLSALGIITASAVRGTYFEIMKNPIERVEIRTKDGLTPRCGESVELSVAVFPINAQETVMDVSYRITDGSQWAFVKGGILTVSDSAPVGTQIEVVAAVDGLISSNSLILTVARTPVSGISFLNREEGITVGGAIKLETAVYPTHATDSQVSYSVISDTPCVQVSYSGVLSFIHGADVQGVTSVTVRAQSVSDPHVYAEKTLDIYSPMADPILATEELERLEPQQAYSFNTMKVDYLHRLFGDRAVTYQLDVDQSIATVDVHGLLYVLPDTPLYTKINLSIMSLDQTVSYHQKMVITPVKAQSFTPVILTQPDVILEGQSYYLPETEIYFDVVAYAPVNVSEQNRVFSLEVSDASLAYVQGHKVIIKSAILCNRQDPGFSVTVRSEPNGLEETFYIRIFLPVERVSLKSQVSQVTEGETYDLDELLSNTLYPEHGMARSVSYHLDGTDGSIAEIKDGRLTVKEDLPAGSLTVRLYMMQDGVRSNTVEIPIYKPAKTITLRAEVNGKPLSEDNLPVSGYFHGDTVMLFTRVNDEASTHKPEFVIKRGGKCMSGAIYYAGKNAEGELMWRLEVSSDLASQASFEGGITLCAMQDSVSSSELSIEIHIANDRMTVSPMTVSRGENVTVVPQHTSHADDTSWELILSESAEDLGVTLVDPHTIYVPWKVVAGQLIWLYYRSLDPHSDGSRDFVVFTIGEADDRAHCVYSGQTLKKGFNFVYGTDSGTDGNAVTISGDNPQLMAGLSTQIHLYYNNRPISDYGMFISDVSVSGSGTASPKDQTADSFTVCMNEDAGAQDRLDITVTVNDGLYEYTLNGGTLYAFRPLTRQLSFNTVYQNGKNMISLLTSQSRTEVDRISGGVSALTFNLLAPGVMIENGCFYVTSYTASASQKISCTYVQYYNGTKITRTQTELPLTVHTVRLEPNGGEGGYGSIVAVSGMKGIGSAKDFAAILPTRDGYVAVGLGYCINADGVVISDYSNKSSLKVMWLKNTATVVFSADTEDRDEKITHNDKYTETVSPNLDRNTLSAYGYTAYSVTIYFDAKEKNDGYQDLWVYSFDDSKDNQLIASFTVEHGAGYKDKNWGGHTVSFTCSDDRLTDTGAFWLRWGAHGDYFDTWWLGYTSITVTAYRP